MGKDFYDRDLIVTDMDAREFSLNVAEFLTVFLFRLSQNIMKIRLSAIPTANPCRFRERESVMF